MAAEPIYKVIFLNQNQVFELYARQIYQSDLYGFIEVEEYVFGERSQIVVDPAEEKLKNEFAGVKRSYIPMHAIIRIDEVEKEGSVKIRESKGSDGKVMAFPLPGMRPQFGGEPGNADGGKGPWSGRSAGRGERAGD
jgi:hypothetical protein